MNPFKSVSKISKILSICIVLFFSLMATAEDDAKEFQQAYSNFTKHAKVGDLTSGLPFAKKVYDLSQTLFQRDNNSRLASAENYAFTLKQLGMDKEAEKVFVDLLTLKQEKFGKYAKELSITLSDMASLKLDETKTKKYQQQYEKIYLRHNSRQFISQITAKDLPSAEIAKNIKKKLVQSFDRKVRIHETQHWSLVAVEGSNKFAKQAANVLEKSYQSMLSFRIALDIPPPKLEDKMVAVYFETRKQQQVFFQSAKWARGKFTSLLLTPKGHKFPIPNIVRNGTRHAGNITGLERRVKGKPEWVYEGLSNSFIFANGNKDFGPHTDNYLLQSIVQIKKIASKSSIPTVREIVSYTGRQLPNNRRWELQTFYPFLIRYLYEYYPEQLGSFFYAVSSKNSKVNASAYRAKFKDAFGDIEPHEEQFKLFIQQIIQQGEQKITERKNS